MTQANANSGPERNISRSESRIDNDVQVMPTLENAMPDIIGRAVNAGDITPVEVQRWNQEPWMAWPFLVATLPNSPYMQDLGRWYVASQTPGVPGQPTGAEQWRATQPDLAKELSRKVTFLQSGLQVRVSTRNQLDAMRRPHATNILEKTGTDIWEYVSDFQEHPITSAGLVLGGFMAYNSLKGTNFGKTAKWGIIGTILYSFLRDKYGFQPIEDGIVRPLKAWGMDNAAQWVRTFRDTMRAPFVNPDRAHSAIPLLEQRLDIHGDDESYMFGMILDMSPGSFYASYDQAAREGGGLPPDVNRMIATLGANQESAMFNNMRDDEKRALFVKVANKIFAKMPGGPSGGANYFNSTYVTGVAFAEAISGNRSARSMSLTFGERHMADAVRGANGPGGMNVLDALLADKNIADDKFYALLEKGYSREGEAAAKLWKGLKDVAKKGVDAVKSGAEAVWTFTTGRGKMTLATVNPGTETLPDTSTLSDEAKRIVAKFDNDFGPLEAAIKDNKTAVVADILRQFEKAMESPTLTEADRKKIIKYMDAKLAPLGRKIDFSYNIPDFWTQKVEPFLESHGITYANFKSGLSVIYENGKQVTKQCVEWVTGTDAYKSSYRMLESGALYVWEENKQAWTKVADSFDQARIYMERKAAESKFNREKAEVLASPGNNEVLFNQWSTKLRAPGGLVQNPDKSFTAQNEAAFAPLWAALKAKNIISDFVVAGGIVNLSEADGDKLKGWLKIHKDLLDQAQREANEAVAKAQVQRILAQTGNDRTKFNNWMNLIASDYQGFILADDGRVEFTNQFPEIWNALRVNGITNSVLRAADGKHLVAPDQARELLKWLAAAKEMQKVPETLPAKELTLILGRLDPGGRAKFDAWKNSVVPNYKDINFNAARTNIQFPQSNEWAVIAPVLRITPPVLVAGKHEIELHDATKVMKWLVANGETNALPQEPVP